MERDAIDRGLPGMARPEERVTSDSDGERLSNVNLSRHVGFVASPNEWRSVVVESEQTDEMTGDGDDSSATLDVTDAASDPAVSTSGISRPSWHASSNRLRSAAVSASSEGRRRTSLRYRSWSIPAGFGESI